VKVGDLVRHIFYRDGWTRVGVIQRVHGFNRITVLWRDGTIGSSFETSVEVISESR